MRHTLCRAVAYAVISFCTRCVSCRTTARTKGTATATIIFVCGGAAAQRRGARRAGVITAAHVCSRAARIPSSARASAKRAYERRLRRKDVAHCSPFPPRKNPHDRRRRRRRRRRRATTATRSAARATRAARASSSARWEPSARRCATAQAPNKKQTRQTACRRGGAGFPDGVARAALATGAL